METLSTTTFREEFEHKVIHALEKMAQDYDRIQMRYSIDNRERGKNIIIEFYDDNPSLTKNIQFIPLIELRFNDPDDIILIKEVLQVAIKKVSIWENNDNLFIKWLNCIFPSKEIFLIKHLKI